MVLLLASIVLRVASVSGADVPLTVAGRVPFVPTRVNDLPAQLFIVDTGATETIITPGVAGRLGVAGSDRPAARRHTVLDSLRVGDFRVENLPVDILDPPQAIPLRLDEGVDYGGILGYSTLARAVTTIDYPRGTLRMTSLTEDALAAQTAWAEAAKAGRTVPFAVRDRLMFVRAFVNGGGPYAFLVDTGSAETIVLPDAARRMGLRAAPWPGYRDVQLSRGNTLRLGDLEFSGLDIAVYRPAQERVRVPAYDGIVGAPLLTNFTVTISYRDHALILAPANP